MVNLGQLRSCDELIEPPGPFESGPPNNSLITNTHGNHRNLKLQHDMTDWCSKSVLDARADLNSSNRQTGAQRLGDQKLLDSF